ncbi:MAG: hypothetical protein ACRCYR_04865 [Phycicoccus sp.]
MSILERRLHVLLDATRYDRLEAEATSSGRSVAAAVRQAIDDHVDGDSSDVERRAAAARRLLANSDDGHTPGESWDDAVTAREREVDEMLRACPAALPRHQRVAARGRRT